MTDQQKFKEYMTVMCEIFDRPVSELTLSVYWKTLQSFDDDACKKAFEAVIATAKFFPKPADFLEILRGKKEDQAARAWIKVVETVRRVGNYQSVKFDDPVIHSVFKFWGGWGVTASWKESELQWKQKEFERLYAIMAAGNKHPEYLAGQNEIDNTARGFDVKSKIIKIGLEDKTGQKQIT
jgi:hypothetical protein